MSYKGTVKKTQNKRLTLFPKEDTLKVKKTELIKTIQTLVREKADLQDKNVELNATIQRLMVERENARERVGFWKRIIAVFKK